MKRLFVLGLAVIGTIALASGSTAGAADDPPTTERPADLGPNFVDQDGDGVCDNCTAAGRGRGEGPGVRDGSRGSGNRGSGDQVGPRDGTGRGKGTVGACDGAGPKGGRQGRRGGRRR